jgi:hypothetical protein
LQIGFLLVFNLAGCDNPAKRVMELSKIAWQFSIEFLPRNCYILIVEINAKIYIICIII